MHSIQGLGINTTSTDRAHAPERRDHTGHPDPVQNGKSQAVNFLPLRLTADLRLICVDPRAEGEAAAAAGTSDIRTLPKWKAKRRRKEQQRQDGRRRAPELLARMFDEQLLSELTERVVLLVGMHPDQATEDVVECGLRNGIPFAVVPCCVFAHLDSRRPTTYEAFVEYLACKDPGVKRDRLNFRGRDTVLYWKGSSNG